MKQIEVTPRITCAICEELHFVKNTKYFTHDLEKEYVSLTLNDKKFSTRKISVACKRALQNGKVSQIETPDQIRCNTPLPYVTTLSKLVSMWIAFAQIRPWDYKTSHMGLTGSIINVPIQRDVVQKALPQFMNETTSISITLKRRLQYKNAYQTGRVRVNIVMRALKNYVPEPCIRMKTSVQMRNGIMFLNKMLPPKNFPQHYKQRLKKDINSNSN